ncbi:Flagellar hook-length control protein FliK [Fimbriiglobus ruber]|uniref:Flagellar hook-length control protein FliK n=1 Tax=Fimbriiglobus ruber TaxID=1908690 RepID=A0A225DKI3_9BACT|nr:Flagellar hook-length control protein FliK [Fimbriiglobus ruber]
MIGIFGSGTPSGSITGGKLITISGANLGNATVVDFGTTPATIVSDTATQIVVTTPAETAGTVDVTVTTPGGTTPSDGVQFTYLDVPTVTAVSPTSGSPTGGTTVTITGTNLSDPIATVVFGGSAATIVSDTATQVVVTSPAHPAGTVDVTVTTPGGTSATSAADHFTYVSAVSLTGYSQFAVGADAGGTGTVTVYNPDQSVAYTATPFGTSYTAGVRVAVADLNNDGAPELIAGTGPGVENQVVILDGKTHQPLVSFVPFEATFTGGVFVTTGDVNGDGVPDLIVTPDQSGGPIVAVYDGAALGKGQVVQVARFFGINDPSFRGGDRAALGDINGDGVADLIVSAGFGGGPRVAIYNGATIASGAPTELMPDFFAFESTLRNGVYVTAGDLTGKGYADLIFGAGPGGGPRVRAVDPAVLLAAGSFSTLDDAAVSTAGVADFFAGDPTSRGGVRVAVADLDGSNQASLVVGSGAGVAAAVTTYTGKAILANPASPTADFDLDPLPGFSGGVFVG